MRPECAWSMSTVGLTAQETSFPIEHPFLRGSYCHSMAGSKSLWSYTHDMDNFYFTMKSAHTDRSSHGQHRSPPLLSYQRHKHSSSTQKLPPKKSRPSHLSLSCGAEPTTPTPADGEQAVPSLQRLSFHECSSPPQTPDRCSKPLPPIPPHGNVSSEQAMDNDVEFFTCTDESCCLVSHQCSKPSPFHTGLTGRRSFRDCGQINHAYYDGPLGPQSPRQPQPQQLPAHPPQQKEVHERGRQELPAVCQRQQDKAQRRLQRSHSGPAGSFNKHSLLRLNYHNRSAYNADPSAVPPPIPPRLKSADRDTRRWSAEVSYSDEDKPPKLPPRDPLSLGSFRTPSPKSLPTYFNGVMPTTQSFAPNPKFVSRGLQRQNSEGSPCILPIMDNEGKKDSNTHYYLLPHRPTFADSKSVEKLLLPMDNPDSDWDCHTRRKASVDPV
ncbi:ERBB receptor feedback inhibitor 1a [Phyllopteryx taeniolatus]|uniref:ERBB receptor feedback inhibitor 1a n=1 Tax=Phyllopteryx taeniolatus TaxID=161469 RepID=UPI002AD4BF6D|nr:ERBB receptor feedback inhibitor 1a [Phyllopteryx taeniolatus]XP_061641123.1 ERBB receptor feedback inhibitor 1a [Phyllopteryx taeniolatus]